MAVEARVDALRKVLDAFNRHDLDAIVSHFSDDCVFESPRGPDRWGSRFVGDRGGSAGACSTIRTYPRRPLQR